MSLAALLLLAAAAAGAAPSGVDALYPELDALYLALHRSPELSQQEEKTAANLAGRLRALGFEVTTGVGGHGIVGLLRNGRGPTVMLRTDLDALPVKEATGLSYASTSTGKDATGAAVSTMHACGHDVHMTSWLGAATLLARQRQRWSGTLMMVGQPAEEIGAGASAMLADGLLARFPRPDYALALHVTPELPAGQVAWSAGPAFAGMTSVDVTIFGKGGHGALPHRTVDPIVLAARTVLALQTIVSREVNPLDPAIVTVGSIHGGTRHNIIPEEVKLQLTVRSFDSAVQKQLLKAIERVVKAEAVAANAPKEPTVVPDYAHALPVAQNDAALANRLAAALMKTLGTEQVMQARPMTVSEDFGLYGKAGVPSMLLWLGATEPKALAAAKAAGTEVPGLHSPHFAPDRELAIRTGVRALEAEFLELAGKK